MITLNKINLSSIDLLGIDLRGIKLGLGGRGGGSGDGFPVLPGDVTRWHFGGLTNEMMAAMDDPRIEDADHKGRFLSFKNFAWSGMSGAGGYEYNFLSSDWEANKGQLSEALSYKITIVDKKNSVQLFKYIRNESENTIKITLKVTGIEINGCTFRVYDNASMSHAQDYKKDGIYQIDYTATEGADRIYFYVFGGNMGQLENLVTIEQLPLYPGFILGDGVDDEAATIDNLDLEDTYTVYTPLILLKYGGAVSGKRSDKDFVLNTVTSSKSIGFDSANAWSGSIPIDLFEFVLVVCKRDSKTMYIKDLITGKTNQSNSKEFVPNPGKYFIWRNTGGLWCQVAIAGQIICNGHFSTDEDDEKVLDWYKKQYPWLFPDQAWTVVGKTNEDADRDTIANITGNGNDLILQNFGFAEESGYGLYETNFMNWVDSHRATFTRTPSKINVTAVLKEANATFTYSTESRLKQRIKVTGLPEGVSLILGRTNFVFYTIAQDGIYDIDVTDDSGSSSPIIGYRINKILDSCDITIEQISEYEGYLVTDGVDDKIVSAESIAFTDTWTIITDAIFLGEKVVSAGILVKDIFVVSNNMEYGRVKVSVKGGVLLKVPTPSIKAICSDGRIYDADWNEYQSEPGTIKVSEGKLYIGMWYNGMQFCSIAFKNIATYNGYALSKDDCIKAYNYLQALKAK